MSTDQDMRRNELREAAQKLLAADYFGALGVSRMASPEEIKKAFVDAARTWHPDRLPPGLEDARSLFTKLFARLELARATLSDPARRSRYIEELAKPETTATSGDISSAEAALEYRKAEALLKKHDVAGAEGHLRRAVQLAPGNVEYRVQLVWVQVRPDTPVARLREFSTELDRLVARAATTGRTYFYRGQVRKRLDLLKEAHADFVRASELDPSNVDAAREVRIFNMRKDKAPKGAAAGDSGAVGFFKKLFKR